MASENFASDKVCHSNTVGLGGSDVADGLGGCRAQCAAGVRAGSDQCSMAVRGSWQLQIQLLQSGYNALHRSPK